MDEPRLVTAAEMEQMTPEERRQLHEERTVTDLSQVDPAFLAKVRANIRATLAEREAADHNKL